MNDDILHKLGVLRGVLRRVAPGEIPTVEDAGREIEFLRREMKLAAIAAEAKDKELAAAHAELRERESAQDELRRWSP